MTTSCPACQADLPDGARFCPACGAKLAAERPEATERRVVTTLFADLVGFTAFGERHDPEDVDAALRAYYSLARKIIERFGGTVEKFIGDAVVGLFGVPLAHEDDAERAVRAALELVSHMHELPSIGDERLEVRAAVNTGPALVRLNARPETGEGVLVGDAVNTCARLLAVAPAMGVVVGETTRSLSVRAIEYEESPPFTAKGKSRPVHVWLARSPIARRGIDAQRPEQSPLIGREVELGILSALLDRAIASSSPQLALVTGEAGIGKSRLLRELFAAVDRRAGLLCNWRQGRCPAYGDGLAYWALREIVSAHAGILQSDEPDVAAAKLADTVPDGDLCEWLLGRLRPLVGLPAGHTEREESFAAWTMFIEEMARSRPTVLVLEDLHWASEPTLAFLEYLVRHAADVPLLLIGTARPEFVATHPKAARFASDLRRIDLTALTADESARLASAIATESAPDIEETVVARCGGNPLYTEELVRFVNEGHANEWPGRGSEGSGDAAVGTPDSLVALIAARLDTLSPKHKSLLANAAVVGLAFWPGALAAIGEADGSEVEVGLAALEHRGFVRRATESSLGSETEFAFWHALIRDVAYEQLPRAARAGKHAKLSRWIEGLAGAQSVELASVRAYHISTAYELAISARNEDLAAELRIPAMIALKRAGDAVLPADVTVARDYYTKAYAMARPGDALGPHLRVALAEAKLHLGELLEAVTQLEEGALELKEAGERRAAAVAMSRLSSALYWQAMGGQAATAERWRAEALDLLETDGPSAELVTVLEERAVQCARDLDGEEALRFADQAIAMSRELGLPEPVRSLAYRGLALCDLGKESGLIDLRSALDLALVRGSGLEADMACQILADATYPYEGPEAGFVLAEQGLEYSTKRRERLTPVWFRLHRVQFNRLMGRWEDALDASRALETLLEGREAAAALRDLRWDIAQIHLYRGDLNEADHLLTWCEEHSGSHPFARLADLGVRVAYYHRREAAEATREALVAFEKLSRGRRRSAPVAMTQAQLARASVGVGSDGLFGRILGDIGNDRALDRCTMLTFTGLVKAKQGLLEDAELSFSLAASAWRAFGDPWEAAQALRDRGRCLAALDRTIEAAPPLREAKEVFARLGARPDLAETEELLAALV